MKKRGQMKLSFGMIFSIILIIIFIAFAFFAINKFISTQRTIQYHQFLEEFQKDVDGMWKGQQSSQEVSYNLPSSIKQVCFTNDCSHLGIEFDCYSSNDNLIFNSTKKNFDSTFISHLDMTKIVPSGRRLRCFGVTKGKLNFLLEKRYGETNLLVLPTNN